MSWSTRFAAHTPAEAKAIVDADGYIPQHVKAQINATLDTCPPDSPVYVKGSGHAPTGTWSPYDMMSSELEVSLLAFREPPAPTEQGQPSGEDAAG